MSKQTINIGTGANSGTGDGLRTAFTKVNDNFTEVYNLYASIPAAQIQSDWNAPDSSLAYIRNKPAPYSLPTASNVTLGGVKIDGTTITISNGVISAAQQTGSAALLLGNTLASNIVSSSLTTIGTLTNLTVTNTIQGSITGNAGTVTNGLYATGSYSNPSWLTSLSYSKLIGTPTLATTSVAGAVKPDGTTVTLGTDGTISVAGANHNHNAVSLIGTTLAAGVVSSSLTSVGTLSSLNVAGPTIITNGVFRLPNYTTTQRNALTAQNGDMIYNSTAQKFQGYQNGSWVNLDTGSAA
jgi:hypothetical protein